MRLDAVARFGAEPSLAALTREAPGLDAIDIADLSVAWGELSLRAQGELTSDVQGFAQGSLDVRARNWREMLRLAVAGGVIGEGAAAGLEFGLQLLARASGGADSLDAQIIFADGEARIGPLILGPAPRLSLP